MDDEEPARALPTLLVLIGLPYSGKSTAAGAMDYPIVSPDAIRLAMHGHRFRRESEPLVWAHAKLMVAALFGAGHAIVILDACNNTRKRRDEWRDSRWTRKEMFIETPLAVCRARATDAGDDEILPILTRMAVEQEPPLDLPG